MLFVDLGKDGEKKIKVDGNAIAIVRELIFLVVYLTESLKDKVDVRGLLKGDDIFDQVTEEIGRLAKEQDNASTNTSAGS
ncbi:MAG: hypothetical protein PHR87_13760 [Sulfurospirillaceae bacterium]|nr:hypothetical protein [Sulfurospirillaceae bacterium]